MTGSAWMHVCFEHDHGLAVPKLSFLTHLRSLAPRPSPLIVVQERNDDKRVR